MTDKVVGYCWHAAQSDPRELDRQKQIIFEYCGHTKRILQYYIDEVADVKHPTFPQLLHAIIHAKRAGAELVIAELGHFVKLSEFTNPLLLSKVMFRCLDQPRIDQNTLQAVVENTRYLRERHRVSQQTNLSESLLTLGNPYAMQEILKVNRPKTESAVLFALILAPIIAYYRVKGYSQRRMVAALNDEGFLAPEGGAWVLSQLQKVLDRIDLNNVALDLSATLDDFVKKKYNFNQMAKGLRVMQVRAPARGQWDEQTVERVVERLQLIREITQFNTFTLEVYPHLLAQQERGASLSQLAGLLNEARTKMPRRLLWELEQEAAMGETVDLDSWDAHNVGIVLRLARRRKEDVENYIDPDTLARAESVFRAFLEET